MQTIFVRKAKTGNTKALESNSTDKLFDSLDTIKHGKNTLVHITLNCFKICWFNNYNTSKFPQNLTKIGIAQ